MASLLLVGLLVTTVLAAATTARYFHLVHTGTVSARIHYSPLKWEGLRLGPRIYKLGRRALGGKAAKGDIATNFEPSPESAAFVEFSVLDDALAKIEDIESDNSPGEIDWSAIIPLFRKENVAEKVHRGNELKGYQSVSQSGGGQDEARGKGKRNRFYPAEDLGDRFDYDSEDDFFGSGLERTSEEEAEEDVEAGEEEEEHDEGGKDEGGKRKRETQEGEEEDGEAEEEDSSKLVEWSIPEERAGHMGRRGLVGTGKVHADKFDEATRGGSTTARFQEDGDWDYDDIITGKGDIGLVDTAGTSNGDEDFSLPMAPGISDSDDESMLGISGSRAGIQRGGRFEDHHAAASERSESRTHAADSWGGLQDNPLDLAIA